MRKSSLLTRKWLYAKWFLILVIAYWSGLFSGDAYAANPVSVSLTGDAVTIAYGESVTLSSTVTDTSNSSNSPVGSVTFTDNGIPIQTAQALIEQTPVIIAVASPPGSIPSGYKQACTIDGRDSNPVGSPTCPVLKWGEYTFWGYSDTNNMGYFNIVQYNEEDGIVNQYVFMENSIRYLYKIEFNDTSQEVSFVGQSEKKITLSLNSLKAASAIASITTSPLSMGVHEFQAEFISRDGNHLNNKSSTFTVNVPKVSSSISLTRSATTSTYGDTVTLVAEVPSVSGLVPTGTVTFYDGTVVLGSASLANGDENLASLTSSIFTIGNHTITARYSGDSNFESSTSSALTHTVNHIEANPSLTSSSAQLTYGSGVTFTVSVPAINLIPVTGTVTFKDGTTQLCEVPIGIDGTAQCSAPLLLAGSHTITASYSGDSYYKDSTKSLLQNVNKIGSEISVTVLQSGSVEVQVGTLGNIIPTGTVDIIIDNQTVGSPELEVNGSVHFSLPQLSVGSHTIEAAYRGTDNIESSVSTAQVLNVLNNNADLSGIALSSGNLSPVFSTNITSYSASVANDVTSIDVTPTLTDTGATVTVNGESVTSGQAEVVALNVGSNTVTVVVTAASGATKTYTVTVERAVSANADLSGITLSSGSLSPAFNGATTAYTASVASDVTSIDVTPTLADAGATVTVNGESVTSGQAEVVALNVGSNTVTVVVIAASGATKTYTVTVERAVSANADLSGITLSSGSLSPAFNGVTTAYTVSVANDVTSIDVTPTLADAGATVTVNGESVTSGQAEVVALNVGSNTVTVVVTAASGATKTYTVTVERAVSANADLSGITLSSGSLSPDFNGATTAYTASVANDVTSIDATPSVYDSNATMTVNGAQVSNGEASEAIPLNVGSNTITIVVKAQDGTLKTYSVLVTRERGSSSSGGSSSIPSNDTVTSTEGTLKLSVGKKGQVSLGDAVKISIPANATDKELILTIEKLTDSLKLITKNDVLASPIFEILKNFSENFSIEITLTFAFDPKSLTDDQEPCVFYYDESKQVWVRVGGEISGNTITVEVNHFTKFAVFGVEKDSDSTSNTEQPTSFNDISGHWAEDNIKQAVNAGIVSGYQDGTFKPNRAVTRAEFAVMLMNALKPQGHEAALTFTDKAKIGTWAQKSVMQAVYSGIITGFEDNTFRPDAEITRSEMATMIAKVLAQTVEVKTATGFADDKYIPDWAKGAASAMKELGIIEGKGTNQFAPKDKTTRAEAVTVLLRMLAQKSM